LHRKLKERLAKEYRYAVTKMQETPQPVKKLFYFSVFFGEAQRILNWEWDRYLALVHLVTQQLHTQVNVAMQNPSLGQALPFDWKSFFDKLTEASSDLAAYYEKENHDKEELCQILGRLAEISYVVGGNGSYLYEKGIIKI
jgi:hypothetical protein